MFFVVLLDGFYWLPKDLLCCRAAEKGNFEAAVKLGIAYLYNEGRKYISTHCFFVCFFFLYSLSYLGLLLFFSFTTCQLLCTPCFSQSALLSDEGRADVCGRKASHFFSLAETLRAPSVNPFIWVFIRPPWSPTGSCCKAVVFDHLKAECEMHVVGISLNCLWIIKLLVSSWFPCFGNATDLQAKSNTWLPADHFK